MDHLDSEHDFEVQIPYVGYEHYKSPQGRSDPEYRWTQYPATQGLHEEDLRGFQWGHLCKEKVESIVQTWLFYGVIFEIFSILNITINLGDFITVNGAGAKIVSTKPLRGLLDQWRQRIIDEGTPWVTERPIRDILELMCTHNQIYCGYRAKMKIKSENLGIFIGWPCSEYTALLISSLGRTLHCAWAKIYGHSVMGMAWGLSGVLDAKLRDQGWCPYEISLLMDAVSVDTQYYLCSFTKPQKDHHECTALRSCKHTIITGNYEPSHTDDCTNGGCRLVGPDIKQVARIINDGGTPLVTWRKAANSDDYELAVARHNSYDFGAFEQNQLKKCLDNPEDYVAISHVWSEGRGNPTRNLLPECQIRAIQEKVNGLHTRYDRDPKAYWGTKIEGPPKDGHQRLTCKHVEGMVKSKMVRSIPGKGFALDLGAYEPIYQEERKSEMRSKAEMHGCPPAIPWFWIDTVCVPVEEEFRETRRKAIQNMSLVYRMAHRCLVLDNSLAQVSCKAPLRLIAAHLFTSMWMHRLWTFQELLLPDKIHFQCQDGDRDLDTLSTEYLACRDRTTFSPRLESDMFGPISHSRNNFSTPGSLAKRYHAVAIVSQLCARSTSHAADELICLASLIGVNPIPYTDRKLSWEDRSANLLRTVGQIDSKVIFNKSPRLQKTGMGWATHSILQSSLQNILGPLSFATEHKIGAMALGTIGEKGELQVEFDGLVLDENPFSCVTSNIVIIPPDDRDPWYQMSFSDGKIWASFAAKFPQDRKFSILLSEKLPRFVPQSGETLSRMMGAPFSYLLQALANPLKVPEVEGRAYYGLLVSTLTPCEFNALPKLGNIIEPPMYYPDMSPARQQQFFRRSDQCPVEYHVEMKGNVGILSAHQNSILDYVRQGQESEVIKGNEKVGHADVKEGHSEAGRIPVKTCVVVQVKAVAEDQKIILRETFLKHFLRTGVHICSKEVCEHGHPIRAAKVYNGQWSVT